MSYIKIWQILKLKSKDNTRQTPHAKFYAFMVKNQRIKRGVWRVFKSPGKIGLNKFDAADWKTDPRTVFVSKVSISSRFFSDH